MTKQAERNGGKIGKLQMPEVRRQPPAPPRLGQRLRRGERLRRSREYQTSEVRKQRAEEKREDRRQYRAEEGPGLFDICHLTFI